MSGFPFVVPTNDQSIYYLGQIFGNVGIALSGTGPALLANMFKVFNTAVLAIGAIIVVYTTVVGVLKSAQEGEFLGKNWNSLWVPLRMVMGIAALFPTKAGYCALQVIVMYIVVQGVGAADTVWNRTTSYFAAGGSIQPSPPNDVAQVAPKKIKDLFGNIVCQAAAVKRATNNETTIARSMPMKTTSGGQTYGYTFGTGDMPDMCGTVVWGINNADANTNNPMFSAAGDAIQQVVPVLENIANFYVNMGIDDYVPPSSPDPFPVTQTAGCWKDACKDGKAPAALMQGIFGSGVRCEYFNKYVNKQFDNASCILNLDNPGNSTEAWNKTLGYAGSNFVSDSSRMIYGYAVNYAVNFALQKGDQPATGYLRGSQEYGWIFAGAFYYYIARKANNTADDFDNFISSIKVNNKDLPPAPLDLNRLDPVVKAFYQGAYGKTEGNTVKPGIADLAITAMNPSGEVNAAGYAADAGPIAANMSSAAHSMLTDWIHAISPSGSSTTNPLVTMQQFGEDLLRAAEALFWTFFAVGAVLSILSQAYEFTALGTGGTVDAFISGLIWFLLIFLLPVVFFIVVLFISIGGLFAVYMPLLPYILFTLAALGWFMAVIEAMIAAPIVALGILSPGGEHEILGRAGGTILLMLNIFLRPTLMIFGMMAGMLLSYVIVRLINAAFYNVVASIIGGGNFTGLIEGFLFIVAYAGLVISALNKCFSLIHVIPENVITWIGGQAKGYGEAEGAEAVKGKVAGAGETMGGAARGAGTAGVSGAKEIVDTKKKKDADDQKQIKLGGPP